MLTERCRCLVYEIAVEYTYIEGTVIVDSGYAVLCLNTVTALVQVLGVLVLTCVVDVPAVLLLQFMNGLDRLLMLHGVEGVAALDGTHYYKQKPTQGVCLVHDTQQQVLL